MALDEAQARELLNRVIGQSTADDCVATIGGSVQGNIRYARNTVTTAGGQTTQSMGVTASFGKQSGSATTNDFSDEGLANCVRRAQELAKLAPENPEYLPPIDSQIYQPTPAWSDRTAAITPEQRARAAAGSIGPAKAANCVAAGFLSDGASWTARATSNGNFGYHRATGVNFSVTMRTPDGTGSGYGAANANDIAKMDTDLASEIAIEKAVASRNPRAVEPGKYTCVLEPMASSGIMGSMWGGFSARSTDEGRSFMAKPGGGSRLGEQVFGPEVNVRSDPWSEDVPGTPWAGEGVPQQATTWIENGVVKALSCPRYWAEKTGRAVQPGPSSLIMSGGSADTNQLIRGTERGILVTRTWYIRTVDPQTVLLTGLTRDGTFYIENGRILYAVKNFRFNESPIIMLNNIDELGVPVRVGNSMVPAMRVRDFTFSSLSDGGGGV